MSLASDKSTLLTNVGAFSQGIATSNSALQTVHTKNYRDIPIAGRRAKLHCLPSEFRPTPQQPLHSAIGGGSTIAAVSSPLDLWSSSFWLNMWRVRGVLLGTDPRLGQAFHYWTALEVNGQYKATKTYRHDYSFAIAWYIGFGRNRHIPVFSIATYVPTWRS
jgi:hypothetical protein